MLKNFSLALFVVIGSGFMVSSASAADTCWGFNNSQGTLQNRSPSNGRTHASHCELDSCLYNGYIDLNSVSDLAGCEAVCATTDFRVGCNQTDCNTYCDVLF